MAPVGHGVPEWYASVRDPKSWAGYRNAAIKASGNAVVPQCAEVVGEVIKRLIENNERLLSELPEGQGNG
jgi:site-specific DNA-cytosine methylase